MPVLNESMLMYLVRLMIILLINPLHECAHAWAAYKLGDPTARNQGRMTLSPIAHIDPWGALLLFACGFGWAKPVPVNPRNFENPRKGMMLTAVAGPLSNLLAAAAAVAACQMIGGYLPVQESGTVRIVGIMLQYFAIINLNLCVFNMVPVPPLDGSRVLTYLLPSKAAFWVVRNQRYFYGAVMVLMLTGLLSRPMVWLTTVILTLMERAAAFLPVVM